MDRGSRSRVIKGIVLVLCCVVVIIPFVGVISTSIASQAHVTNSGGFVLWPDGINLDAYRTIFNGGVVTAGAGGQHRRSRSSARDQPGRVHDAGVRAQPARARSGSGRC